MTHTLPTTAASAHTLPTKEVRPVGGITGRGRMMMQPAVTTGYELVKHEPQDGFSHPPFEVRNTKKPASCAAEQCRSQEAKVVSTALSTTGMSRQATADACGVSRSMIDRWTEDEHPHTMPIGRVLVMAQTSTRGRQAARIILTSLLTAIDAHEPATCRKSLREMVDDFHAEVGSFASVWREAIRDGVVSTSEATALIQGLHSVEMVCEKLRTKTKHSASREVGHV